MTGLPKDYVRHNLLIQKVFAYNLDQVIVHYVTIVLIQRIIKKFAKVNNLKSDQKTIVTGSSQI